MFIIKGTVAQDFDRLLKGHQLLVATSEVYYQNARMLNGRHKILDLESYNKFYKNILNDIELVTEPVDAFMPAMADEGEEINEDEVHGGLFVVNRVGPEYEKIDNRVTWEDMQATLPPTHPAVVAVIEDPNKLQTVKDDIYIYYSVTKYIQKLDEIRLMILSNMTPAIEYVVKNIDEKVIKHYLHTKKINLEKFGKIAQELFFKPDFDFTRAFYEVEHGNVPAFDMELVMQKLISNIDCKVDKTIVTAIYLAITFAITDIKNDTESECANYVRDVICKI